MASVGTILRFCFLFIGFFGKEALGERILFLTPVGSKSHKNFFMGITEELAQAGHQVTMVSTHKDSKERKNIRDVHLSTLDAVSHLDNIFDKSKQKTMLRDLVFSSPDLCVESLASKEVEELKKEQFDLVIISMFLSDCYASLAHHFQVPLIHASPAGLFGPFSTTAGNVHFSSLEKNELVPNDHFPYSFFTRLQSVFLDAVLNAVVTYYIYPRSDRLCRERGLCTPEMPSLRAISENASLVLLNSVKAFEQPPRPAMPNIIYAGGVHCHPAKPLPKDLEEWASTAENGIIFFSLGSGVKPSDISEEHRKIFINVFGSLKQRVLWKWNKEHMDDLPSNVRLGKWLPQQDLLGHKNMRLFITHGGLLSTLEATYHGVPIIGMPVFGDQHSNIAQSVSEGWASVMDWDDLEEKTFRQLIIYTIENESFRKVVKKRSKIMRDLPRSPGKEALYWIEYVLRHDGAEHIKSPIHKLPTYQLYSMDVWATIGGLLAIFCLATVSCMKFLFRCFKKNDPRKKKYE